MWWLVLDRDNYEGALGWRRGGGVERLARGREGGSNDAVVVAVTFVERDVKLSLCRGLASSPFWTSSVCEENLELGCTVRSPSRTSHLRALPLRANNIGYRYGWGVVGWGGGEVEEGLGGHC